MKKKATKRKAASKPQQTQLDAKDAFKPRNADDVFNAAEPEKHVFGHSKICSTDSRGYPTPHNRSPAELVLDASDGFIPLWQKDVTLRWRFNEGSMRYF